MGLLKKISTAIGKVDKTGESTKKFEIGLLGTTMQLLCASFGLGDNIPVL